MLTRSDRGEVGDHAFHALRLANAHEVAVERGVQFYRVEPTVRRNRAFAAQLYCINLGDENRLPSLRKVGREKADVAARRVDDHFSRKLLVEILLVVLGV